MHWYETGNIPDYLSATCQCLELLRADSPLRADCCALALERFAPMYRQHRDWSRLRLVADCSTFKSWMHSTVLACWAKMPMWKPARALRTASFSVEPV